MAEREPMVEDPEILNGIQSIEDLFLLCRREIADRWCETPKNTLSVRRRLTGTMSLSAREKRLDGLLLLLLLF
jgi:hypothetical protein